MTTTTADAPLLATKLFVPKPRQNRVSRARLRDQLDAARGGTVTLAAAAAGSGKSTLLADWALSSEKRVAWLSLDPADDDPRRFLNYVIAAFRNAAVIGETDLAAGLTSPSQAMIDATLAELLNLVAAAPSPAALVLDDYHVIESESVHRIVQFIIDHVPPTLHLVLASRVDPPLGLSRLRARDHLLEIRAGDLRFTTDEAAQFLNQAMGLQLTDDQVAQLEERTEGWAVGLQMAAISMRGQGAAKTFISGFSGSNRYVLDYLTDEVLQRQGPDVRAFLLETSILDRLAAPLCDAVTGRNDSQRLLQELEASNLFLIPLDDVRYWYRYHHLFGSLLQHQMERSMSAERIAELHRRASAWYASKSMPEPALRHAVSAHDDDRAVAIVSEHAMTRIIAGDGATIVKWVAQLPPDRVENNIDLLLMHSIALVADYQLDFAMRQVNRAEKIIPAGNADHYQGAVLSLRGMLERMQGHATRAVETLERAMTLLKPDDFWFSMTSFNLGMSAMMDADVRRAELYLGHATAYRDKPGGVLTAVLGRCYGGWCALWRGLPDEAVQMAAEANRWVEEWDAQHATGRPLSSLAYGLLADVHRLWNDLARARELAELGVDHGKKGFLVGYFEASRVLAQVAEAQGDWDAALKASHECLCAIEPTGNPQWMEPMRALHHRILWHRGQVTGRRADLDTVVKWCEESGLLANLDNWREHLHAGLYNDFSVQIAARVLMHQERFTEGRDLLEKLLKEAVQQERLLGQIIILVLRSSTEASLGHTDQALATMQQALEMASKPRFLRPLLDEGSAVLPLIERAAPRIADRDFATRVFSGFSVPPRPHAAPSRDLAEPLSDREIEVLRLIAAGVSTQDAARKLFVATSTIKKHLENVYAKLGVGGRTQAVARARELQIL